MLELKVKGMTCGSCAIAMEYALKNIDPSVQVSVDLTKQTVQIKSVRPQNQIVSLIEDVGYPVLEAKEIVQ